MGLRCEVDEKRRRKNGLLQKKRDGLVNMNCFEFESIRSCSGKRKG